MARYTRDDPRRQGALSGAAVERQSGGAGRSAPTDGIGRDGSIRIPSPPISSRWSPAISSRVEDSFTTRSGRVVPLAIWVRRGDEDKCGHAMASLKKAMRWDEETFGLEYDLDVFNIVAVSDFNMGAMENKGLNIFNTRYVLAKPETATDSDYQGIEAVIAHEYFHNWTGDRVTCRDWFQLSLKEGLTVFRDQLFSADQGSPAVCRIGDIRTLRAAQFPEDAGPLAHPVQPQSYLRIDNFYTATVYNKGAEVVRMIHTLLGPRGVPPRHGPLHRAPRQPGGDDRRFRRGDAGRRRRRSRRLRAAGTHQAGTPEITVEDRYDAARAQLRAERRAARAADAGPARQSSRCRSRSRSGCIGPNGDELPTRLDGESAARAGTRVLVCAAASARPSALSMCRRRRCRRCCATSRRRSSSRACRSTG